MIFTQKSDNELISDEEVLSEQRVDKKQDATKGAGIFAVLLAFVASVLMFLSYILIW